MKLQKEMTVPGCAECPMAKIYSEPPHPHVRYCGFNNQLACNENELFSYKISLPEVFKKGEKAPDWCPLKTNDIVLRAKQSTVRAHSERGDSSK